MRSGHGDEPTVTRGGPATTIQPNDVDHDRGANGDERVERGDGPRTPSPTDLPHRADPGESATVVLARPDAVRSGAPSGRPAATVERRRPARITTEAALYGLLLVLAVLTRFWDLGSRALHHDESLHTQYSWLYATGQNYVHDPLMHGPFLFHANALVYLLLGDSDATSRFMPALFGVALVGLPWLLRGPRLLGRWGALAASALFLISPALLYQSRYIRHDVYTVVGALVLFTAIVRYLDRPQRRWLVVAGAAVGFLLTNHEIVFGIVAVFGGVLWGALLWGRLRSLVPLHLLVVPAALLLWKYVPGALDRPLPQIPWDRSGRDSPRPTRSNQLDFYQDLVTNPLTIAFVVLAIATVAAAVTIVKRERERALAEAGGTGSIFDGARAGSVEAGVRQALADPSGLSLALSVGAVIFAVLYTSLFTNLNGLATGTIATDGTLLYWLGQHEVQRGEQPWFYYLLLLPQYEFFAVLFGGVAAVAIGWTAARALLGRTRPGPRFFVRLFLAVWFVAIFAALSWAGEKMPWLTVHISLPATLLAASLLGELAERGTARPRSAAGFATDGATAAGPGAARTAPGRRWVEPALATALLVAGGAWFLLAGRFSYGTFVESAAPGGWSRTVTSAAIDRWWWMALPPLAALGLIGFGWLLRGPRGAGRATLTAVTIGLALLQIHTGWRMAYQEGDVPKDMLIYTQTSPDVSRMVGEIERLSAELTGGRGMEIWYDDDVSWPMQWYLRDFPNLHLSSGDLATATNDAPIVITGGETVDGVGSFMPGYTAQQYVLRWWFPEETIYRNFAIAPELPPGRSAWQSTDQPHGPTAIAASVRDGLATLLDPEGQQRAYRLAMYRDLPDRIQCTCYTLLVRNDLVPLYNTLRY